MNEYECQECGAIFDDDFWLDEKEVCPNCGSENIFYIGD